MEYTFSIVHLPQSFNAQKTESAYKLSNGTILFPSAQGSDGCYWGAVGMDGVYLRTGVRYCPVFDDYGHIAAFRKEMPLDETSDKTKA